MPDDAAPPSPPAEKPKAAPKRTKAPSASSPSAAKPADAAPAPKSPTPPVAKAPAAAKSVRPAKPSSVPKPTPKPVVGEVIDVSGLVLGRAAGLIAKRLLKGEQLVVVNAEKSVVTGDRQTVIQEFATRRARGSVRSGPHYPRYPDRIFRRAVRGMLPHLKTRGKVAFDRLTVHIGVPPGLETASRSTLEGAKARPSIQPPTTLQEITRLLGAKV